MRDRLCKTCESHGGRYAPAHRYAEIISSLGLCPKGNCPTCCAAYCLPHPPPCAACKGTGKVKIKNKIVDCLDCHSGSVYLIDDLPPKNWGTNAN